MRELGGERRERDVRLESSQGSTEAEMRAVAEAHVAAGVAVRVEVVGVREAPFVPVGRPEKGDDLLAPVSYTHLTLPTICSV